MLGDVAEQVIEFAQNTKALESTEALKQELNSSLIYLENYEAMLKKTFTIDENIPDDGAIEVAISDINRILKITDEIICDINSDIVKFKSSAENKE